MGPNTPIIIPCAYDGNSLGTTASANGSDSLVLQYDARSSDLISGPQGRDLDRIVLIRYHYMVGDPPFRHDITIKWRMREFDEL